MAESRGGVSFAAVLRVAEFRAMWAAECLSVCGDQLARVALTVLVFAQTSSATLTALTYALTFVPALIGGVLLSGLGDRYPRRTVMVAADLGRAALVGLMLMPAPLWLLGVLVAVTTLLGGPFKAAQQALLPDVLPGELYRVGMAVRTISGQAAQVAGLAGGGLLAAELGPRLTLGVNAASFLASAVLLVGLHRRPAARQGADRVSFLAAATAGARLVWADPPLRTLLALGWLTGFYVVAEALAAPYAGDIGAGAAAVGVIMAAVPFGSVVAAVVFARWVPESVNVRQLGALAVAAGVPLACCGLQPGLLPSLGLIALSGALTTGYHIQTVVEFTRRLLDHHRAGGAGLAGSGLIAAQGFGALAAGALADTIGVATTVAAAGVAGTLVAVPIARRWARVRPAA